MNIEASPTEEARYKQGKFFMNQRSFWYNLGLAIFWGVTINLILGFLLDWFNSPDGTVWGSIKEFSFGMSIAISLWITCSYLNAWLTTKVDWLERPLISFAIALTANLVGVVFAISAVYYVHFGLIEGKSGAELSTYFHPGNYIFSTIIALLISAIYQGAYFLKTWKFSVQQTERLKSANISAKYQALNAQVNPHFLFNSLNVLSALVKQDPQKAEEFIQGLSKVYRYVLDVKDKQLVDLREEIDALKAYTDLLKIRFGERFKIELINDQADINKRYIVPLSLQMLVENAVKHNGATRKTPLHITLDLRQHNLVVKNNKVALYEKPEGSGLGLLNIDERYKLLNANGISIRDEDAFFEVELPLLNEEHSKEFVPSKSLHNVQ